MRNIRSTRSAPARHQGFSLIEIMVALTLSLILLAGVLAVVYSSKVTYMENERVGRIQESGRAALEMILRDLRGAGFPGCAQPINGLFSIKNMLASPTAVAWNLAQPVYGFEAGATAWTPALDAVLIPNATVANDIIAVRTIPAGAPSMRVSASVSPSASISVQNDVGETLTVGRPAIVSDCGNASIFVVGGFTVVSSTTATVTRTTGGGPPSNTTTDLGATFGVGSRVAPISNVVYYVSPSASGTGPALWRVVSNAAPEEIIPGVQAMQVRYGISTGTGVTVTSYVNANAVTDWSNVISVSLALLVRSAEPNSQMLDSRTYSLLGTSLGPFNDRYERSLLTTTVTLRNRTT